MTSPAGTGTLRIGLVGCGRWGSNILRDLLELGAAVVVADPDPAARERARQAGASDCVAETGALPADLAGYVVASPTVCHAESVSALLPRNKPVFCEKPLCPDLASARELAGQARAGLFVMDKWRYHPAIEALASLVREQTLGPLQQVRSRRVQWGQPHEDVDGVWILAPHDISIVHHIMGQLPRLRAAAGDASGASLDGMTAILEAGDGATAVIEVSSRAPFADRQVMISCARGCAWMNDPLDTSIRLRRGQPGTDIDPQDWETLEIDSEWPLRRELRWFLDHLRGGPPPLTNAELAVAQVALIEECRRQCRNPA